MKPETKDTLDRVEDTCEHVFNRIYPLLHNDSRISVENLGELVDIMKDCTQTMKDVYKIYHYCHEHKNTDEIFA